MKLFQGIMVTTALASLLAASAWAAADAKKVGVIGAGKNQLQAEGASAGMRTLKMGDDVFFKDKIVTGPDSSAQIIFVDKSTLTVGPNSNITVDEFVFDPAASTGKLALSGTKGVFRFVGGALSKKQPVEIKTPVATIGVRGAIADVAMNADTGQLSSALVFGNEMSVTNDQGTMTTNQIGTQISVPGPDAPPAPPVPYQPATIAAKVDGPPAGNAGSPAGDGGQPQADGGAPQPDGNNQQAGGGDTAGSEGGAPNAAGDPAPGGEPTAGGNPPPPPAGPASPMMAFNQEMGMSPDGGQPPMFAPGGMGGAQPGPGAPGPQPGGMMGFGAPPIPMNPMDVTMNSEAVQDNNQEQIIDALIESGVDPSTIPGLDPNITTNINNQAPLLTLNGVFEDWDLSGEITGTRRSTTWDLDFDAYQNNFVFSGLSSAPGPQTAPGFSLGGVPFDARFFNSPSGAMSYFVFTNTPNHYLSTGLNYHITGVVGTVMTPTALPTSGFSMYKFLPDLGYDYDPSGYQHDLGFDYSLAGVGLLPASVQSEQDSGAPYGVVIDWARNKIFGGGVMLRYENADNHDAGVMAMLGDVDRGAAEVFSLEHFGINFSSWVDSGSTGVEAISQYGSGSTDATDLFGINSQNLLDGFLLGTDVIYSLDDNQAYGSYMDDFYEQPLVRVSSTVTAPSGQTRAAGITSQYGFAAGFVGDYNHATGDLSALGFEAVMNSWTAGIATPSAASTGVSFVFDGFDSDASADFALRKVDVASTTNLGASAYLSGTFSNTGYLTDQQFIIAQTSGSSNGGSPGSYGIAEISGGIVALPETSKLYDRELMDSANPNQYKTPEIAAAMACSACDFVTWGVWAADMKDVDAPNAWKIAHLIPFISGAPTIDLGTVAATANLTQPIAFNGQVIGNQMTGTGASSVVVPRAGYFNSVVDFGNAYKLTKLDIHFAGQRFGFDHTGNPVVAPSFPSTGVASLSNLAINRIGAGTGIIDGKANVALFGPQAQNMGGNFTAAVRSAAGMPPSDVLTGVLRGAR